MTVELDAQTIALLGRDLVIDQLHRSGLEVALPRRDHGIDVIAYVDKQRAFQALPIQVKASAGFRWVVNQKYGPFAEIVIAFALYLADEDKATVYVLPHTENLAIAERLGLTQSSATWLRPKRAAQGGYVWIDRPRPNLLAELKRHRATPEVWRSLVMRGVEASHLSL
jgi:hypothetical protein